MATGLEVVEVAGLATGLEVVGLLGLAAGAVVDVVGPATGLATGLGVVARHTILCLSYGSFGYPVAVLGTAIKTCEENIVGIINT